MDSSPLVESQEPKPAPMPLLLVQAFVNTRDLDRRTDRLAELEDGRRWLAEVGLIEDGAVADKDELALARSMREAVRVLLEQSGDGRSIRPDVLGALEQAAGAGRLQTVVGHDGSVELEPEAPTPVGAALVRLLAIIRDAQRDGTWSRLKACENDECRWAYFDRSHSRRGRWCEMSGCGNRAKNRALRARRR